MAIMTINNRVENVGQSVALNLTVYEEIVPIEFDVRPALAKRKERCDAYRNSSQAEAGSVLFPHDPLQEDQVVGASMADIRKTIEKGQKNPAIASIVGNEVGFVLIGCANYRSSFEPIDAPRHQTTIFYWLGVPGADGGWRSGVEPVGVASKLQLIGTPLYFSAD